MRVRITTFVASLAALLFFSMASASIALAEVQRMGVSPQTITVIGGGGGGGADSPAAQPQDQQRLKAFCLDRRLSPPTYSHALGLVPGRGSSQVTPLGGGPAMSLSAAIETGRIRIEGTGRTDSLRAVSLDGDDYRIEIKETIALADDVSRGIADVASGLDLIAHTNGDVSQHDVWGVIELDPREVFGDFDTAFVKARQWGDLTRVTSVAARLAAFGSSGVGYGHASSTGRTGERYRLIMLPDKRILRERANWGDQLIGWQAARVEGATLYVVLDDMLKGDFGGVELAVSGERVAPGAEIRLAGVTWLNLMAASPERGVTLVMIGEEGVPLVGGPDEPSVRATLEGPAAGGGGAGGGGGPRVIAEGDFPSGQRGPTTLPMLEPGQSRGTVEGLRPDGAAWIATATGMMASKVKSVTGVLVVEVKNMLRLGDDEDGATKAFEAAIEPLRAAYEAFPMPSSEVTVRLYLDADDRGETIVEILLDEVGVNVRRVALRN